MGRTLYDGLADEYDSFVDEFGDYYRVAAPTARQRPR
jgi:hypothetical protein